MVDATTPRNWSYNPSGWSQRLPIVGLALVGFGIASYLIGVRAEAKVDTEIRTYAKHVVGKTKLLYKLVKPVIAMVCNAILRCAR